MFLEKAKRGYNQWFLYVFTLVVVFLGVQVGSIPVTAYALAAAGGDLTTAAEGLTLPRTNAGLALTLLAFAVGVAVLLFCVVKIHRKRWTDTLTGRERFDWGRVGFGAAVWGALSVAFLFLQYGTGDTSHLEWQFEAGPFAGMCAVLVLLMPFQVGFEEWVFRGYLMQGCALLFKRGWAAIYKRPTPIRIVKVDPQNPSHITSSFFAEKSTTDFVGVYRSRYIDFECKESSKDTLELTNIRPQQLTHLDLVLKLGGIGFFLVCFTKRQEVYLLDAHYILDSALKQGSRSGFKRELFQEKGRLITQGYAPRLEILKAIDEEYFKTPFDPNNPEL